MNPERVVGILREVTRIFRKPGRDANDVDGPELVTAEMDSLSWRFIDVHFAMVKVNLEEVEKNRDALVNELSSFPDQEQLRQGMSYLDLGLILGSHDAAVRLIAVGKALDVWEIVTPERKGFTGQMADELARAGLVMCVGYDPS